VRLILYVVSGSEYLTYDSDFKLVRPITLQRAGVVLYVYYVANYLEKMLTKLEISRKNILTFHSS